MSSGESNAEGIAANLQQSMDDLMATTEPMEKISENSRALAREIEEKRLALGSILGFFAALPERLEEELASNYMAAQRKYEAVADRTLPVLEGAQSSDAREARRCIKSLVELNPSWIPISRMQSDRGDLEGVVDALRWLDGEMIRMQGGLRHGASNAVACVATAGHAYSGLMLYQERVS